MAGSSGRNVFKLGQAWDAFGDGSSPCAASWSTEDA